MLDPDRKLTRARFALMRDHPFFATILLQLDLEADEQVETIETDGRQIRYAPSWLAGISERHLQAVLAHNVMHIAFEQKRAAGPEPRAVFCARQKASMARTDLLARASTLIG